MFSYHIIKRLNDLLGILSKNIPLKLPADKRLHLNPYQHTSQIASHLPLPLLRGGKSKAISDQIFREFQHLQNQTETFLIVP